MRSVAAPGLPASQRAQTSRTQAGWSLLASFNQFAANAVGAIIMAAALFSLRADLELGFGTALILSLFGGILSPVAKDLVAALRRVRDG